eukprot:scaffold62468_cov45-Attheya_sp.AAC.3
MMIRICCRIPYTVVHTTYFNIRTLNNTVHSCRSTGSIIIIPSFVAFAAVVIEIDHGSAVSHDYK